jgi:hypothetical protein
MKKFLINILLIIGIPFLIILALYWITDPFKINKPFSLDNTSIVNREYLSVELFLKQNPTYHYNSFIFGSSRGCGINTYTWKDLLNKTSSQKDTVSQFLFQAWGENINGINQKVAYLDKNNIPINNALLLVDVGFFKEDTKTVLGEKHYAFSGDSKFSYWKTFILAYMESPSEIFNSVKDAINPPAIPVTFDTVSNDWAVNNRYNFMQEPVRDSTLNRSKFGKRPAEEQFHEKEITAEYLEILKNIKGIFDKNQTQYTIIVTPSYDQIHINTEDLQTLEQVFGKENVYNFSGKNDITEDKYNWDDPNHFSLIVGWWILHDIYKQN